MSLKVRDALPAEDGGVYGSVAEGIQLTVGLTGWEDMHWKHQNCGRIMNPVRVFCVHECVS